jgi:hypothetical protein
VERVLLVLNALSQGFDLQIKDEEGREHKKTNESE